MPSCKRQADEPASPRVRLVPSNRMRKNMKICGVSEETWEQRARDTARVWGISEDEAKKVCGAVVEGGFEDVMTQPKHDVFRVRG